MNWHTKVICSFVTKKGLKCKACNVYRADRHFNFRSRTLCARPCAADVVSRFRNKKTQHINASTDISVFSKTGFSTASSNVTSTSTRLDEVSGLDPGLPDSLSGRQIYRRSVTDLLSAEHTTTIFGICWIILCKRSCCVFRVARCERHCICKSLGLSQTDLELRCGPILTTQLDGNPSSLWLVISPFPLVWLARLVKHIAWPLLLVAQSSSVERRVALVRVCSLWWNMGTKLGGRQPRAGFEGRVSRATTSLCPIYCPKVEKGTRVTALNVPLLPCLDVPAGVHGMTHRANSRHQVVKIQSWRIARSLTNPRSIGRSQRTTNCG